MNFEFPKMVFRFFSFSSFIIQDVSPWPQKLIFEYRMKNDEVWEPASLRHSALIIRYSIFFFGSGLSGLSGQWTGKVFIYDLCLRRTKAHPFSQFWKTASGAGKQNHKIFSRFYFYPYVTIYYHKNPYIAVSSGHNLGTVAWVPFLASTASTFLVI
jgi:hypothetical protein